MESIDYASVLVSLKFFKLPTPTFYQRWFKLPPRAIFFVAGMLEQENGEAT